MSCPGLCAALFCTLRGSFLLLFLGARDRGGGKGEVGRVGEEEGREGGREEGRKGNKERRNEGGREERKEEGKERGRNSRI